jgi:hypothetical protein
MADQSLSTVRVRLMAYITAKRFPHSLESEKTHFCPVLRNREGEYEGLTEYV